MLLFILPSSPAAEQLKEAYFMTSWINRLSSAIVPRNCVIAEVTGAIAVSGKIAEGLYSLSYPVVTFNDLDRWKRSRCSIFTCYPTFSVATADVI